MRLSGARVALVGLIVAACLGIPALVAAQESGAAPYKAPNEGKEMYVAYCGSCHGAQGRGDGPAATALKVPPADLTVLMKNNGGTFPEAKFRQIMANGTVAAHGNADMPIWGQIFKKMDKDPAVTAVRIENLMKYVQVLNYPIK
ncbi:MAG: c-type cytochrome [Acidobacteria bacterium]|nr:c-type cytochrome [Acidobacteriota bacterium]